MALDKDIVGSIEFLEVIGLEGSTYLLKGPNGEQVKLNQSEINDEDELETGEEYSFFIYPNRSGELFATQNMPDITKDKYDFAKVLKTDRDGACRCRFTKRSANPMGRFTESKITMATNWRLCTSNITYR